MPRPGKAGNAGVMNFLLKIPQRARKLIGVFILVPFLTIYSLLAMVLAVRLLPGEGFFIVILYYAVAGLFWVLPAAGIIWFMQVRKSETRNRKSDSGF